MTDKQPAKPGKKSELQQGPFTVWKYYEQVPGPELSAIKDKFRKIVPPETVCDLLQRQACFSGEGYCGVAGVKAHSGRA